MGNDSPESTGSIRGSPAIQIDDRDGTLLLDLADGSTVTVAVEGTTSDDTTELTQHYDGGGWPCWKVEGQEYVSVMFSDVDPALTDTADDLEDVQIDADKLAAELESDQ